MAVPPPPAGFEAELARAAAVEAAADAQRCPACAKDWQLTGDASFLCCCKGLAAGLLRYEDGAAKDDAAAARFYARAADQGYANADFNLGICYADGKGVARDADEATRRFERAAARGDPQSKAALAALRSIVEGPAAP